MADEIQRFRQFRGQEAPEGVEPVAFELGDERFTCLHAVPLGAMAHLSGKGSWSVADMLGFVEGILVEGDLERFRTTVERKDVIVTSAELAEVVYWLLEAISARPTDSPSGSPNGSSDTGTTSTGRSRPRAVATSES